MVAEARFIDTDPALIEAEVLTIFQNVLSRDLYPAQLERLLVDVATLIATVGANNVNETGKQNLLGYAVGGNLDQIGAITDTPRLVNGKAQTTFRFSISPSPSASSVLIPVGTRVTGSSSGIVFTTKRDAVIAPMVLYTDVNGEASEVGPQANDFEAGSLTTVMDPLAGVPSGKSILVTNLERTQGGLIEESDDAYRERLRLAANKISSGGSVDSYRYHALGAHPSIIDVQGYSPAPVYVTIYVLTETGSPNTAILDAVFEALDDEKVRPITDIVTVEAAQPLNYDIVVDVIAERNVSLSSLRADVLRVASEYATECRRQLGKDVIKSELAGRIQALPGVYNHTISEPAVDLVVGIGQFASVLSVTVNVLGFEGTV